MKTVLFILLLCPLLSWAQDAKIRPDDTSRKRSYLLLRDGSFVKGRIIRQDSLIITVRKAGGALSFIEADQLLRISADRPKSEAAPSRTVFVLRDGSQIEGELVRQNNTMITVRKRSGQMTYFEPELLLRTDSVAIPELPAADARQTYMNQFSPWLLTGVTAHNAEKGRFYYRNTWLLLNEFNYGITRFWSVGASFVLPIPYLFYQDKVYGSSQYVEMNTKLFTKISVPIGTRFRLGVNATYQADRLQYAERKGSWNVQALVSAGSSQRNVTVGFGIGLPKAQQLIYLAPTSPYSSSIPQYTYVPVPNQTYLSVGVMQKVSPGLTLISDNRINLGTQYRYYTSERITTSFALRVDRQRHAFDLGLLGFIYQQPWLWDNKAVRILPYLTYNLLIGRN